MGMFGFLFSSSFPKPMLMRLFPRHHASLATPAQIIQTFQVGEISITPKQRLLRTCLYSNSWGRGQGTGRTDVTRDGGRASAGAGVPHWVPKLQRSGFILRCPAGTCLISSAPPAGSSRRPGRAADMGPRQPRCGAGSR